MNIKKVLNQFANIYGTLGPIDYNNNYLPSGWIANLGVVPLFVFAAFLLAPIFFTLFSLLVRVTRVLETIIQLLSSTFAKKNTRNEFLHFSFTVVKRLTILVTILQTLSLHSAQHQGTETQGNSIVLSKGEIYELKSPSGATFSIGNSEVIKIKPNNKKGALLIKAIGLGESGLIIWPSKGKKISYSVYVLPKKGLLKNIEIHELLKGHQIQSRISGTILEIFGQLETIEQYEFLASIYEQNKDRIKLNVSISSKVQNAVLGNIYHHFFNHYYDLISCQMDGVWAMCRVSKNPLPHQQLTQYLKSKYLLKFIPDLDVELRKNYKLKMKILLWEHRNGDEINIGLDEINISMDDLFKSGLKSLIKDKILVLKEKDVELSTLADQEIILLPGVDSLVKVGADIPFHEVEKSSEGSSIQSLQWKFAGLSININLNIVDNKYIIHYKNELSRFDGEDGVSGSQQQSALEAQLGKPAKLFHIVFQTNGEYTSSIPYIHKFPVLGRLFKSTSSQSSYKKITAIINLEEVHADAP